MFQLRRFVPVGLTTVALAAAVATTAALASTGSGGEMTDPPAPKASASVPTTIAPAQVLKSVPEGIEGDDMVPTDCEVEVFSYEGVEAVSGEEGDNWRAIVNGDEVEGSEVRRYRLKDFQVSGECEGVSFDVWEVAPEQGAAQPEAAEAHEAPNQGRAPGQIRA